MALLSLFQNSLRPLPKAGLGPQINDFVSQVYANRDEYIIGNPYDLVDKLGVTNIYLLNFSRFIYTFYTVSNFEDDTGTQCFRFRMYVFTWREDGLGLAEQAQQEFRPIFQAALSQKQKELDLAFALLNPDPEAPNYSTQMIHKPYALEG